MKELGIKFDSVDVDIITGLDALGRSQEAGKLDRVLRRAAELELRSWFKDDELLARYTAYEGVDTTNLLKTPNEVQAEQAKAAEAANQQAMMAAGAESTGKAVGESAGAAMQGGGNAQPQPQQ